MMKPRDPLELDSSLGNETRLPSDIMTLLGSWEQGPHQDLILRGIIFRSRNKAVHTVSRSVDHPSLSAFTRAEHSLVLSSQAADEPDA